MNEIQPSEHERVPEKVPATKPAESTRWYHEVLETSRTLVGLPVLVSLFLEVFKPEAKALGTAIAAIAAFTLHFFPKLRSAFIPRKGLRFWTALPWFLTSALALLLVFKVIPARSKEKDNLIKQQENLLTRAWLNWQINLEKAASQCSEVTGKVDAARGAEKKAKDQSEREKAQNDEIRWEKARDNCLSEKLKPVLRDNQRPPGGVASELMAGQLMLAKKHQRSTVGQIEHRR